MMDRSACSQTPVPRNLFDDCAWLYMLCREYLFHDHTKVIVHALFPDGDPGDQTTIVEVGCGPGYYARQLAKRYARASVFGVDQSSRMVSSARRRALADRLGNCHFIVGDVESLSSCVKPADAMISSRLFLVVPNRHVALAEMFRVLKPGGRLFLAEPTADFKARLPLIAMRLAAKLITFSHKQSRPDDANVLNDEDFEELVRSQPWSRFRIHMHGDYRCAICEKENDDVRAREGANTLEVETALIGEWSPSL